MHIFCISVDVLYAIETCDVQLVMNKSYLKTPIINYSMGYDMDVKEHISGAYFIKT